MALIYDLSIENRSTGKEDRSDWCLINDFQTSRALRGLTCWRSTVDPNNDVDNQIHSNYCRNDCVGITPSILTDPVFYADAIQSSTGRKILL